jgi:glycosyltransferase involved in cell wall biosynthesis
MGEKLTVLVPCKNERRNISACIASFRGIADEVLIADSQSTDDTLDIVRRIGGCRIIEREFVNYSDFKNWAIPQAAHDWVLIVDADERVTPQLADEIRRTLADPPDQLDGYWIGRENYFMGHHIRHCGWNTDDVFRLFRRDRCRYRQVRVHEEIDVDARRAGRLRHKFVHYTYWSYDQFFAKHLRYTQWGAQDMWDRGRRAGWFSLLVRPMLRFVQLYIGRLGFLDGLPGLQVCMLTAFFNTFVKQARLWE